MPLADAPEPNLHASPADQQGSGAAVPDLLQSRPASRLPLDELKTSIALAFAGGTGGGLFSDALGRAQHAPSCWEPKSFTGDLFLQQFVQRCFQIRVGSRSLLPVVDHLTRALAAPPSNAACVEFRRGCVAELIARPELRGQLERLYLLLCQLRSLLEGTSGANDWDANRRRLDVLKLIKDVLDNMAVGFPTATSGLTRLSQFGRRVQQSEGYTALADLLSYDENLATVSLKVGVGADGRIRGVALESVEENRQNPFVNSPLRRWLVRLELFARGYRFGEGEVMAHLIDAVYEGIEDELVHFVQLFGDVEFYLGALSFKDLAGAAGLDVCLPELVPAEQPRRLIALFNPLLLALEAEVVPCDLELDRHDVTVLITGPNSGGKTRLLQSLGLSQLLAQGGLFIPAREGSLALTRGLVVSLIQETKADQAEGRLGMELLRIRELFQQLPPGAMVILDELCSGTNPSEGEEIFELVVRMLIRLKPQVFITTHFLSFAARLNQSKRIPELRFLQVQLGPDQQPTYQFTPGVAETSLAGQAAARLGVTATQLTELIDRSIARTQS